MVQDFRGFRAVYCATFWSGEQSFNSFALVVEAEKVSTEKVSKGLYELL